MAAGSRGAFITLEGGEGSGKTGLALAIAELLRESGQLVCLTHEPGGTELGRLIERLFSHRLSSALTPLAELLLFEADRVQHVSEVIAPALATGRTVVCDRFTDSSLAYQGNGRGLDLELIRRLNEETTGGLKPDLTLLLDVPPEVGLLRKGNQSDVTGREPLEFHTRVREGFLNVARAELERVVVIDGTVSTQEVRHKAVRAVHERLARLNTLE